MSFLVGLIVVAVVAVVAVGLVWALSGRARYRRDNEVVPGVATKAPGSWAGAHSPEAKLHRRLRDAVRGLHASALPDDVGLLEVRATLEQQALAVDERLVAVAALPQPVRAAPLAQVEAAVRAIEQASADLTATLLEATTAGAGQLPAEVTQHLDAVAAARDELDRTFPMPS